MKFLSVLLLLVAGNSACHNTNEKTPSATIIHTDSGIAAAKIPVVSVVNDTMIRMRFDIADTGMIASAQSYKDADKHITCEIDIAKADSIHAAITPVTEPGNIRFNQIFMPDGKADGPFGQTIAYATPQSGTYKLIIGQNLMAGDRWSGNFKLKVWVK